MSKISIKNASGLQIIELISFYNTNSIRLLAIEIFQHCSCVKQIAGNLFNSSASIYFSSRNIQFHGDHTPGNSWKVLEFNFCPGNTWKVPKFQHFLENDLECPEI